MLKPQGSNAYRCAAHEYGGEVPCPDCLGSTMGDTDMRLEERVIMQSAQQREHVTRDDLRLMHERLCEEARNLMRGKNIDYAAVSDPFRNFRAFGELGILVRLTDKIARLRSFVENGSLAIKEESVRDTVLDTINYAVLFWGYLVDEGKLMEGKVREDGDNHTQGTPVHSLCIR